ncbi:neuronal PAS domain-containing protein 4B-like [Conger conger]|uniref:neuronal PAS domain-containing protein 4B-like n=1 Tax=Conger conger TaxID=82655 RepID=UPI002A5A73E2|nr:neuronal PAS domain-containing protein 4B-like [Conger conger]
MYRSTKGASKARRDQINAEIRNLKELLPISEAEKARLSYLHIMSLACMYTRKSVFFSQESETSGGQEGSSSFMSFQELSRLVHELPGFLLMLTSEGKLLYLSDSVTEHLGHSMVDLVAQGDSVYDIIDPTDHFVMRSNLSPTTSADTDRLFRCRFHTSKSARRQSAGTRLTLVRAHCLSTPGTAASYWTSNPAWLCFCSPLEGQPCSPGTPPTLAPPADHAFFLAGFHSRHSHDMRVQDADDSVSLYLGYDVDALRARSWYSLLHPQDLPHASAQHCCLLGEGGEGRAEMVVRVQMQDSTFTWLYMVLHLETGDSPISCRSYVVSEAEACSVRQQLCTEQAQLALVLSASASYQDSLGLRSPDTLSSPDQVFTPSSGGLSGQSFDFTSLSSSEEPGGAVTSLEEEAFPQQQAPPPLEPGQSPPPAGTSAHLYCRQHGLAAAESVPTPLSDAASPPASQNASARGGVRLHRAPLCPPGRKGRGYQLLLSLLPAGGHTLYEKLPPTPDTPEEGDCTLMPPLPLPPLYVDLPPRGPFCHPLEGLLTPEASPTEWPLPLEGEEAELEQERAEISYLAQQISSLAEQLSSASSSGSAPLSNTPPLGRDPVSPLAEMFHPVKRLTGRVVVDPPRSLDEGSLFEQSALQSLLLPLAAPSPACWSASSVCSVAGSVCSVASSVCSVRSTHPSGVAGGGATAGAEEAVVMETESSSVPECPAAPATLTAPVATPSLPRAQPSLGELVAMEPVFGAGASIAPVLGQQPELHQLHCDPPPTTLSAR